MFLTLILLLIFLTLSGLHVYWAFGGKFGIEGVIPTKDSIPLFEVKMFSCLAIAFALLAAGLLITWKGWFPNVEPKWISNYSIWILATIFALRAIGDFRYVGFFKRVCGNNFARNDTLLFSPLCAVIAVLLFWLAL